MSSASKMKVLYSIIIFLSLSFLLACRGKDRDDNVKGRLSRDQLAEINRQLIIKDRERIMNYIERKDLDMKETDTGLWISSNIPSKGGISEGDHVVLEYKCSLLDGSLIYDSDRDGLLRFEVGKPDVPSGLNEGVKLLDRGSEAVMILPGYLGYGLLGDEDRIPARSVLVYRIKVLEVD